MTDLMNNQPGVRDNQIVAGGSIFASMGGGLSPKICFGSGAPTLSATQGSIYSRTDGSSSSTRLYVNSDGGTTWVAITTAS